MKGHRRSVICLASIFLRFATLEASLRAASGIGPASCGLMPIASAAASHCASGRRASLVTAGSVPYVEADDLMLVASVLALVPTDLTDRGFDHDRILEVMVAVVHEAATGFYEPSRRELLSERSLQLMQSCTRAIFALMSFLVVGIIQDGKSSHGLFRVHNLGDGVLRLAIQSQLQNSPVADKKGATLAQMGGYFPCCRP
jgi:hypothetical protein